MNKFRRPSTRTHGFFSPIPDGVLHKDLLTDRFEAWAAAHRHIEGRVIAVTQAGMWPASSSGSTIPGTRRQQLCTTPRVAPDRWDLENHKDCHLQQSGRMGRRSVSNLVIIPSFRQWGVKPTVLNFSKETIRISAIMQNNFCLYPMSLQPEGG